MSFRPIVYARVSPDLIAMRIVGTDARVEDTPDLAVERGTDRVREIGRGALGDQPAEIDIRNGFRGQGVIIGDVDAAEIAFRYWLEILFRSASRWRLIKPDLVIHPIDAGAGELTSFELQGLVDLGRRAGARAVDVYVGSVLSDQQVLDRTFRSARSFIPLSIRGGRVDDRATAHRDDLRRSASRPLVELSIVALVVVCLAILRYDWWVSAAIFAGVCGRSVLSVARWGRGLRPSHWATGGAPGRM